MARILLGNWAIEQRQARVTMQVVVPEGVMPGHAFNVQTPTGAMLRTVVPEGVEPGQTIMINTEQTMQPAQPAQMTMQRASGPALLLQGMVTTTS